MATYMPGHITIGGPLAKRLLRRLAKAVVAETVSADWGNEPLDLPACLTLVREAHENQEPVVFYHELARYGRFENLEAICRKLGLTYVVHSDAGDEWDAGYGWWQPGMDEPGECAATNGGEVLITIGDVRQALEAEQPLAAVTDLLARAQPPDVPPLTLVPA